VVRVVLVIIVYMATVEAGIEVVMGELVVPSMLHTAELEDRRMLALWKDVEGVREPIGEVCWVPPLFTTQSQVLSGTDVSQRMAA